MRVMSLIGSIFMWITSCTTIPGEKIRRIFTRNFTGKIRAMAGGTKFASIRQRANIVNVEREAWDGNYAILEATGVGHYIGCNLSVTNFQGPGGARAMI